MVSDAWTMRDFEPMTAVPHLVSLTTYSGRVQEFLEMPFDDIARDIATGAMRLPLGPTFRHDDIAEAHRCIEGNQASGKIVVITY